MAAPHNHVALRVRDVERSVRFYIEALDARVLTKPTPREGAFHDEVFATPGVKVRMSLITLGGTGLELWQFAEPDRPLPESDQTAVGIMHFAIQVDDVPATLERVEAAGGRARFPVKRMARGGPRFVYCEDVDGHVFELMEMTIEEAAQAIIDVMPDSAP
jgi:catechol 2,3-dioxygenase-like lactoylglutathione lyase family enzyme